MKTRVLQWVLATFLFVSCSNTEEESIPTLDANSEKWALVKMTGSFTSSETTGEDMEWQEYYIFNSDDTFIKYRNWDEAVKEAAGKYKRETLDGEEYLELTYSSGKELLASCSSNEFLYFKKGDVLRGNWGACDGPILDYEQLKK